MTPATKDKKLSIPIGEEVSILGGTYVGRDAYILLEPGDEMHPKQTVFLTSEGGLPSLQDVKKLSFLNLKYKNTEALNSNGYAAKAIKANPRIQVTIRQLCKELAALNIDPEEDESTLFDYIREEMRDVTNKLKGAYKWERYKLKGLEPPPKF